MSDYDYEESAPPPRRQTLTCLGLASG